MVNRTLFHVRRRVGRRWAQHALILSLFSTTVVASLGYTRAGTSPVEGAELTDPPPAELASLSPAMAPLLPNNPEPDAGPVVTVASPVWLRTTNATSLWASAEPRTSAFTDVPAGSWLRIDGPLQNDRWPVYYQGDGLLRLAGRAWVNDDMVQAVDAPAPGQIPQVDAYATSSLPTWVTTTTTTAFWSGPDTDALKFSDLPAGSYLKVNGLVRDGRVLVQYGGDYGSRVPGLGWVDQSATTSSLDPGVWVQNHRASVLYAGPDGDTRFNTLPQWSRMRVVDDTPGSDRILVEYYGDNATRQPGRAWVPRADLGRITPPSPLPPTLEALQAAQARTFATEMDFVNTIGGMARKSQAITGVPASVTVAQAILESDWGRSKLTRQGNNLFGIKALSGPGSAGTVTMPTWEVVNGQNITVQAAFKAYYTLDESVEDHGWFFIRNRRYAPALAVANDAQAFARAIQQAGYATDPGYANKLIKLMDKYDLYQFDPETPKHN